MEPRSPRRRRLRGPRIKLRFSLRKAAFVLPNLFTVASIFCGFYALVITSNDPGPEQLYQAALAVFFGIFFDMADGRVARLTRTQSAFGVQLDSLADVISFGVAPALIVHRWALADLDVLGFAVSAIYVSCGALRLARFNVLAQRSPGSMKFFIGLPIPLAAGVVISLVMFHQRAIAAPVAQPYHILALVLVLSYLMVSNVRYRTFKDAKLSPTSLAVATTLVTLFVALAWFVRPTFALLAFVSGYVAYGLFEEIVFFRRRRREDRKATPPTPAAGPSPPQESSR